jgi:hypothetical protein
MKNYVGGGTHSREWKEFRGKILLRAENRCEGTPQHPECRAAYGEPHPETGSKVVLTIAHMDWDESHADPERCRALCQRCHNRWDSRHRQKNAAKTRRRKAPQIDLEDWLTTAPGAIT